LTSAPPTAISSTSAEIANWERGHRQLVLHLVGLLADLLVFLHLRVDFRRGVLQPGQLLVDLPESTVERTPERHEAVQDLVARLVGAAVLAERLGVYALDRALDLLEQPLDHLVAVGLDLGDRGDRLDPLGRRRRHLAAFLIVLLDAGDLLEELALQRRVAFEIARDHGADALELPLDLLARLLAPVGEQDRLVALPHVLRGGEQPARAEAQRAADHVPRRPEQIVHQLSRGVEERHRDDEQDQRGSHDVVGPDHPELVAHETSRGPGQVGRLSGQRHKIEQTGA
jgi:hypothetical protein